MYLHCRSNISSAKPNRIVPIIVRKTAKCIVKFSFVDHIFRITVKRKAIIQNETAAANPTHYGISFYPYLLPFLLISRPYILLLFINYDIFGMRLLVNNQLITPNIAMGMVPFISSWKIANSDDSIAKVVVNES